jgi:hypothetical protein
MKRITVLGLVVLSGCLDSLTLFPEEPAVVAPPRPRQEVLNTNAAFDAGVTEPTPEVDAGSPEPMVDAGPVTEAPDAGVVATDAGSSCVLGTLTDCGACGDVCAAVPHADSMCSAGRCGRGLCHDGFFDLDPAIDGCETSCVGTVCGGPNGPVNLTAPPVNERAHGLFSTTGTSPDADRGSLGQQGGAQAAGTVSHRAWFH